MTTWGFPLCGVCTHLSQTDGLACQAFPDGIPEDIWQMRYDHRNPYPGDNGVLFEPKPGTEKTVEDLTFFPPAP